MSAPRPMVSLPSPPAGPDGCGPVRSRWLFPIAVVAVVVAVAAAAVLWILLGHPGGPPSGPWPFPWPLVPFVFPFVFPFLFFAILWVGFFRWGGGWGGRGGWNRPPTALEILEMRYARGEITRDQFREMRGELMGSLR
jgi:putative membrane protein